MTTDAFNDIKKLEDDLWEAADNLRANSKLTSLLGVNKQKRVGNGNYL